MTQENTSGDVRSAAQDKPQIPQNEVTISDLAKKILATDKQYDLSKILSAYQLAEKAHAGQKRSSGEPYIIHPLAVADILLDLGMDTDTICVGLLHDVVEDTEYTLDDIRKKFGQDVAMLVDGVTKLNRIPIFDKEQQQAENVRKILLAMSHDIRVMIIKLADRIHNMRTLKFLPPEKQRRIALETMNVYAPIAHRLGIRTVKDELEDLAFYYLDSYAYSEIEHIMEIKKDEREKFIESIKERIRKRLAQEHFAKEPIIEGRVKSIYGIYKKVYVNHKGMDEIYDKYAVRVIVSTVAECYMVLGIVHDMFRPLPNRFKDYISTPKSNMYQSLHTTVLGRESIPFEIQIRTWDMHVSAEYGIAAHWKYKEGIQGKDKMEERLAWVRKVIEAQQTSDDVEEIVRAIKNDLSPEDIVVMTPRGDSISAGWVNGDRLCIPHPHGDRTQDHRRQGGRQDGSAGLSAPDGTDLRSPDQQRPQQGTQSCMAGYCQDQRGKVQDSFLVQERVPRREHCYRQGESGAGVQALSHQSAGNGMGRIPGR